MQIIVNAIVFDFWYQDWWFFALKSLFLGKWGSYIDSFTPGQAVKEVVGLITEMVCIQKDLLKQPLADTGCVQNVPNNGYFQTIFVQIWA